MKDYLQIVRKFRKNIINLLCFELMYRVAVFCLVIQGARLVFNKILAQMGYSYLTAENFSDFIRNPLTIAAVSFFAAAILLLLFFELCTVCGCFLSGYGEQHRGIRQICLVGGRLFLRQLKQNHIFCLLIAAMTGVFACTHFMVREIMEIKILNYAAQQVYRWSNDKYALIVLLVLGFALCIASMYLLPVLLCENMSWRKAIRRSLKLFWANRRKALPGLVVCNVVVTLGVLAVYYLLMLGASVFVAVFREPHAAMAALFSLDDMMRIIAGFLSGMAGVLCNMQLITGLYLSSCPRPEFLEQLGESKEREQRKGIFLALVFLLVEAVYLYSTVVNGTQIVRDMYAGALVTAHRGGAKTAPENTAAALEAAIENMADYAEIDIQETMDGVLILLHDSNFKRTAGVNQKVWETTWAEVQQMDAGSSFSAEFAGEPIPTLQEVLELCRDRLDLNIEVKSNGHNDGIAQKTANLVLEMGMEDQCVISSMNYSFLKQVKETAPDIRTGYIMSVAYGKVEQLEFADFMSVEYDCVDERFVQRVHEAGKEIHVWTVNSRREMRRMKALGVDNIITDRPGVAREILMEDKSGAGFLELLQFVLE